jgi:hypothetical protein
MVSATYELVIFIYHSPWPESASELCRPRDRSLSAKSVPTFTDGECNVVSVTELRSVGLDVHMIIQMNLEMGVKRRHCLFQDKIPRLEA